MYLGTSGGASALGAKLNYTNASDTWWTSLDIGALRSHSRVWRIEAGRRRAWDGVPHFAGTETMVDGGIIGA